MKKSSILAQVALAGIAAGLLSPMSVSAADKTEKKKVVAKTKADTAKAATAKHACAGKNACKGQGGCAMTEKDLKARAKKLGIPLSKAGKAHGCKGQNACKGLGGCNM